MNNTSSLIAAMPILVIMATGMLVLLADSCLPFWRRAKVLSASVSLIGILVAAFFSLQLMGTEGGQAFSGAMVADAFAQSCNLILLITAGLAVLVAMTYLENKKLNHGEYYVLVLFSTAGAMLMAAAGDLITLFVAIETLSVALYVMAGFARTEEKSEESALKYFLLGAFAAGFLLYGIALIYGGSAGADITQFGGSGNGGGTTNLAILSKFLQSPGSSPQVMLMTGIALLLVGLAFKAGLVPFHQWTPDVYEGAPTSVTAYMAAAAKIGAFAAILRVFNALIPISQYWLIAIQVLAILTMFGGNILAVTQDNVKRMLAYSSIAHAGYLMVAVSAMAGNPETRAQLLEHANNPAWLAAYSPRLIQELTAAHDAAFSAVIYYLLAYALMTIGAFAVLIWLSRRGRDVQTLSDLKGLGKTDPAAAYVMLVFMLSLGGIPPTMGFLGKWFIFYAAIQAGQTWLAITLAFASMISIYYYLKVVWMMCFQEPDEASARGRAQFSGGVTVAVVSTVAASLLFGLAPNLVHALMNVAAALPHP